MAEYCSAVYKRPAIAILVRSGWGETTVLGVTFFLTVFRDLTEGIVVGFGLGSVLFIQRMSRTTAVSTHSPFVGRDVADNSTERNPYKEETAADPDIVIYRITGALFFGAVASIGSVLDRIQDNHKALIIDFSAVPFLDSSGANMIKGLARTAHKRNVALWLTGANHDIQREFVTHGLKRSLANYATTVDDAVAAVSDPIVQPSGAA